MRVRKSALIRSRAGFVVAAPDILTVHVDVASASVTTTIIEMMRRFMTLTSADALSARVETLPN